MEKERTVMSKIKEWFLLRFLPAWAKESVYKENQKLRERIEEQQNEIERLNAYASGLEYVARRRVIIRNEVKQ